MLPKSLLAHLFLFITTLIAFSCIEDHPVPPDNTERDLLLFRNWNMLSEENGIDTLANVIKSTLLFSADGTFTTNAFPGGIQQPPYILKRYWKWHPTISNRLLYWHLGREVDEKNNYIDIRLLTEETLKISYHNYYGELKFSFVPEN